ncbi:MAG: hypothetical protein MJ213_02710 [Bacilli bacterium]|nr:hypothetical protein [Bacilli bacterium]
MNIKYDIATSTSNENYEVIATYEENNQSKREVILIKKERDLSESEIIKLAQKEMKKIISKRKKDNFFAKLKKHKVLTIAISTVLVAGIATGVSLGVIYSNEPKKEPDNFDKMHTAYKDYLISTTTSNYENLSADEIMNKIVIGTDANKQKIYSSLEKKVISNVETYYIKDINYEDGFNRDSWPASTHVSQALNLAITAETRKDPKIKEIAIKMTYYWVFNNYRNTNWWQNELGVDNNLASLGLFIYDDLNPKGQSALRGKIADASFYYRESLMTHTGANLFDYADITVKSSIISKNQTEFNIAKNRINDEICDDRLEGFQTDGSFFQHGQQVQIASYGKGVGRLGKVLSVLTKAGVNLSEEKMAIVERYLLRGLRSMTHKGYLNYSSMSREIARPNQIDTANNNFGQFNTYLDVDTFTKKEELQKYLDDVKDKKSTFDGMVYFDKAKMVAINVDGVYMSFKGTAPNLTNTECVNDENQLGLNLSYGTNTCVMDTGTEYYNIMPIWDYSMIPGTTSINLDGANINEGEWVPATNPVSLDTTILTIRDKDYYNDQLYEQQLPEPTSDNGYVYSSTSSIEKSETDKVAVLMQRSNHHKENNFTVTCVATPEGMVLLGADLGYTGDVTEGNGKVFNQDSRKLHTTLEQIKMPEAEPQLTDNNHTLTCGNVVYTSLGNNPLEIKTSVRSVEGGWERNRHQNEPDKEKTKGKTFTAYFDHGDNRDNAKYAYSIQSAAKVNAQQTFTVIKNFDDNLKVQEVKLPSGKTIVVSYQDLDNDYMTQSGKTISKDLLKEGHYQIVS